MHPVLKRIAIYGTLTAIFLGVIGMMIGGIAVTFVPPTPAGVGPTEGEPNSDQELISTIQTRMPIMLAIWGFVFVAAGEVLLYIWPRRKPAPQEPTIDEQVKAEEQIQLLLALADAKAKAEADAKAKADALAQKPQDQPNTDAEPPKSS